MRFTGCCGRTFVRDTPTVGYHNLPVTLTFCWLRFILQLLTPHVYHVTRPVGRYSLISHTPVVTLDVCRIDLLPVVGRVVDFFTAVVQLVVDCGWAGPTGPDHIVI